MKKVIYSLALFLLTLTLVACGSQQTTKDPNPDTTPSKRVITDPEGSKVIISTNIERIISTAPSNSEILLELGLGEKIVAVDNYTSDHEDLAKDIIKIDFRSPDVETIIGLLPDIIIASGHNKTGENDPYAPLKEAGIPVVYIPSAASIQEIYDSIEFIADITKTTEKGNDVISDIKSEINDLKAIADTITTKKTVYLEISPAPYIYTTGKGTFQNELLEIIGAENVFASEEGWISPSAESIIEKNPDVILTNVDYVDNADQEILAREGWGVLNAITNGKVYLINANASSRPSQNVIEAAKEMAKLIYPEYYE